MTQQRDDSKRLIDSVNQAVAQKRQLSIVGQGTKAHYARSTHGDALQTRDHVGILEYQPDELTISVRAGTPLIDIENALNEHNQVLACDPPRFFGGGTIGGAVACGLSGPGRPWFGNLRDAVLGVEMVNGRGERLRFGGSVMKNVAGFDISRMLVGSLGLLGVILSVNLRVHPKPEVERTLALDSSWSDAWSSMCESLAKPTAVTGTCFLSGMLYLRLSGSRASVDEAIKNYPQNEEIENDIWADLRDHDHSFFKSSEELRRAWLGRGTQPPITNESSYLIEWAGAQVWSHRAHEDNTKFDDAVSDEPFDRALANPISESKYVRRLRLAFDPHRLFNSDLRL